MVRECTGKDKEQLLAYLKEEAVYNTFLLADIEDFGFEEPFQTVYMDEEQGEIKGIYLCFYQNFLLYCRENEVNISFLEQLFSGYIPDVVMGKTQTVQIVQRILTEHVLESRDLYLFADEACLEKENPEIRAAGMEDVDDIFAFLQSIDELRHLYTSKQMIADRIEKNCGVHYIIRRDGKIIAHANSAAQCEATTMIGGVSTAPKERGQGLGGQVVSRLCRDILAKGKTPCLFSIRGEEHNLYHRIGFQKIGEWGTLTKPADGCRQENVEKEQEKDSETEKAVPRKQGMPSYIPIYNQLYEDIVNGVYEKGSLLPSEHLLAEKYHVSRNTLRQALTILNQDGYIYKKQGKGTFVSYDSAKKQKDKIYNFLSEDALEKITDIHADHNIGLPTKIAQIKLHLADGEEVLASNNVYVGENGPIGQSFLQIPLNVLAENQIDTKNEEQLLEFMNKGVYRLAAGSEMSVQLMEADEQVVPFLGIEPGTPLLHFEQLLFDKKQKPYARIKYYFCSGKYQIQCRW